MKKIRIWQAATSTSVKYLCNIGAHRRKVTKFSMDTSETQKTIVKTTGVESHKKAVPLLILKTSVLMSKELSITAETKAGRRETLDLETSI